MSINKYEPHSHFFVDHTNLNPINSSNEVVDAFGPVVENKTTQYRTTSFVRASTTSKVLAICDGHILIQPYDGDSTKVNLIIKPTVSYAPLKIKYFIYRGVNKDDLIFGFDLVHPTPDSPEFIKRVWKASNKLAEALNQPLPLNLDAKLIGYNPGHFDDELLSYIFFGIETEDEYNIPKCFKGEFIGNFTGRIGLDIILDYGDYELDYEEQLFKLDLGYARKPEHVFDVTTITGAVKQKRYREYIHQFIDAAAFWGSHIDCGEISLHDASPITNPSDIYVTLVSKYQTANKLYLYIQAERGRSYNFYEVYPPNNVSFEIETTTDYKPYQEENWPIRIREFHQLMSIADNKFKVLIQPVFNVNASPIDRHRITHVIMSNWNEDVGGGRECFVENSGFTQTFISVNTSSTEQSSVANMIMITYFGIEDSPEIPYYDDLFGLVNIKNVFDIPVNTSEKSGFWVGYIQKRALNLNAINRFKNSLINTKVVFDKGEITSSSEIKERRLYISKTVDLQQKNSQFITSTPTSEPKKDIKKSYFLNLYRRYDFEIYKGKLNDSGVPIDTLTLVNTKDHLLKQSFFQLGILEEEYNKLMYNSPEIPNPLPSPPHIPTDAANIRFFLQEDTNDSNYYDQDYRKFKLGVKYENANGNLDNVFPSSNINIYTIDGFFFFSPGFSEFQDISKTFAKSLVNFRPKQSWLGDFGLDWIRRGDFINVSGSSSIPPISISYKELVGYYYNSQSYSVKTVNEGQTLDFFRKEKVGWFKLQSFYPSFPVTFGNESLYNGSWCCLYPSQNFDDTPSGFPLTSTQGGLLSLVEADFELNIEINSSPTSLKLLFEKQHFMVNSIDPSETIELTDSVIDNITYGRLEINNKNTTGTTYRKLNVHIKCLKEFRDYRTIKVIATENGLENLAGHITFLPNAKDIRRKIELIFVQVKTKLSPILPENEGVVEGAKDRLAKFLNHALIDIASTEVKPLNLESVGSFNNNFVGGTSNDPYVIPKSNNNKWIHDELMEQFEYIYPNYNKNSFILFFINEFCVIGGTDLLGMAYPAINTANNNAVIFREEPSLDKVEPHELFHCGGLYHTFSNQNEVTFKKFSTDNLMDYSETPNAPVEIPTLGTWKWQWEILWKHSLMKNEK